MRIANLVLWLRLSVPFIGCMPCAGRHIVSDLPDGLSATYQVPAFLAEAEQVVAGDMPDVHTGKHGKEPYCCQDTWAMVEVAYFLARFGKPLRPAGM